MALRTYVTRDSGHPWDGRLGFDILELEADTPAELESGVKEAASKFWQPWIIGVSEANGLPSGALYKPCEADADWTDSPENRHPGNIREPKRAALAQDLG